MYDIENFVSRYFGDYRYYGNPATDISICCPFCDERGAGLDTKYHLQLHMDHDKQVVHCFRCGYSASWVQFVMAVAGVSYVQALGELYVAPKVREDLEEYVSKHFAQRSVKSISKEFNLPADFRLLANDESRLAKMAKRYLRKRGFGEDVWYKHNLGVSDEIGYRVIIPIERGYWQGRSLHKLVTPKYYNPHEPARDILFNAQALHIYEEVVVCEGFFSAVAVGDNAIAMIGKEPTTEKLERMAKSGAQHFIIALEAGAFVTMRKLADSLVRSGKRVTIWKYETGDPADSDDYKEIRYDLKSKVSMLLK